MRQMLLACSLCGLLGANAAWANGVPSDVDVGYRGATRIADAPAGSAASLALVLPLRHHTELTVLLHDLSARNSPSYHKYLSPAEFQTRFGPSIDDQATIIKWAQAGGLSVQKSAPGSTVIIARGSVTQIGAMLGVTFGTYRAKEGRVFLAADRAPNLPQAIASRLIAIAGLNDQAGVAALARPLAQGSRPHNPGNGPLGGLSAADLRTAYDVQSQSPAQAQETVAIFEQGGFDPNDVAAYQKQNKLPNIPVGFVPVNGAPNTLNGTLEAVEAALDIDAVSAMYPHTKQILVYGDGQDTFDVAILGALLGIAVDDQAQTVSISYGTDEVIQGRAQVVAENQLFEELQALGIGVFVAAGDDGAYGRTGVGLNVSDPAAQPTVTAVGGTTLFTDPAGQQIGEITWNDLGTNGATGGGVSKFWPIPLYQALIQPGPINRLNGASPKRRNIPDVAAVGDPYTGAAIYCGTAGGWLVVGGTSLSAPLWAGFYALNNSVTKALGLGRIGNFNESLYNREFLNHEIIGLGTSGANSDIVDGSNGNKSIFGIPGYNAGLGFDDVSGLGSPIGGHWLGFLWFSFDSFPGPAPKPPTNVQATATRNSVTLTWNAAPNILAYLADIFLLNSNFQTTLVTSNTSVTFTGLQPATTYYVQLGDEDGIGINGARGQYITTLP